MKPLLVLALAFATAAFAEDFRQINSQPYSDAQWQIASCRFLVLKQDGAYGNPRASTFEGCINGAEFGLMQMANGSEDESAFHFPAVVEFADKNGARHTCRLEAKKLKFDKLPRVRESQVSNEGFYDSMSPELRGLFDENFTLACQTDIS